MWSEEDILRNKIHGIGFWRLSKQALWSHPSLQVVENLVILTTFHFDLRKLKKSTNNSDFTKNPPLSHFQQWLAKSSIKQRIHEKTVTLERRSQITTIRFDEIFEKILVLVCFCGKHLVTLPQNNYPGQPHKISSSCVVFFIVKSAFRRPSSFYYKTTSQAVLVNVCFSLQVSSSQA